MRGRTPKNQMICHYGPQESGTLVAATPASLPPTWSDAQSITNVASIVSAMPLGLHSLSCPCFFGLLHIVEYSVVQYSTVQYSIVWYSRVEYSIGFLLLHFLLCFGILLIRLDRCHVQERKLFLRLFQLTLPPARLLQMFLVVFVRFLGSQVAFLKVASVALWLDLVLRPRLTRLALTFSMPLCAALKAEEVNG